MDYFKKILKKLKINKNKNNQRLSNLSKIMKENELSSPFSSDFKLKEENFNEKKIKEQLQKIISEKDHHLIDYIIKDKEKYFPNNLKSEVGVFRDKINGNLLAVAYEKNNELKIPKHVIDIGFNNGLSIISHNHTNGLTIPSIKDINSVCMYQSNYNPIYSPNKISLLINISFEKNQNNCKEITNNYNKFLEDKKHEIQRLYAYETKKLKDNYTDKTLDKKLNNDLYRPYFSKNQEIIAKEVNQMFKENNIGLKLYIL